MHILHVNDIGGPCVKYAGPQKCRGGRSPRQTIYSFSAASYGRPLVSILIRGVRYER